MTIVFFILGALARVWYGADGLPKLLQNRGLQTVYMMLLFVACFYDNYSWQGWCVVVAVVCWLQFQFWSRGHGCCFDLGRDVNPTADTIDRYDDRWYHKVCDKLLPNHKYGFLYDFFYLMLRYFCPMIPMMIFDWRYILVGFSIAPIYAFSITLGEREPWIFEKQKWYWRRALSLAEILSGGVVYASCYLLGV
jgi:hypothetical protein